jgi:hypothetical protein
MNSWNTRPVLRSRTGSGRGLLNVVSTVPTLFQKGENASWKAWFPPVPDCIAAAQLWNDKCPHQGQARSVKASHNKAGDAEMAYARAMLAHGTMHDHDA